MSTEANWTEPGRFDFNRFLRHYLTADDLYDMDEGIDENRSSGVGVMGAVVVPSGESVQRVRDPLSEEAEREFGRLAFKALARTDVYLDPEDKQLGA